MTAEPSPPPRPWGLIAAPLIFAALAWVFVGPPMLAQVLIGAAGWVLALALRPLAGGLMKAAGAGPGALQIGMVAVSGPAEELVRWPALGFAGGGFAGAVWLGIGWALAEALSGAGSVVAVRRILAQGGERAEKLKEQMEKAGEQAVGAPLAAGIERFSVTGMHVGLSLWIAASVWMVLPAMLVHSGFNIAAVAALGRTKSMLLTEVIIGGGAVLVLGVAWVLWA